MPREFAIRDSAEIGEERPAPSAAVNLWCRRLACTVQPGRPHHKLGTRPADERSGGGMEAAEQANVFPVRCSREDLARRLDALEQKYDAQFQVVFDAIRQLMAPPPEPKRRGKIGFLRENEA